MRGGKRQGAGRKPKRIEEGREAFLNAHLTQEKLTDVMNRMLEIACGSDAKAAVTAGSLILAYAFGKPTEKHEHSNPDGSALLQPVADALTKVYGSGST